MHRLCPPQPSGLSTWRWDPWTETNPSAGACTPLAPGVGTLCSVPAAMSAPGRSPPRRPRAEAADPAPGRAAAPPAAAEPARCAPALRPPARGGPAAARPGTMLNAPPSAFPAPGSQQRAAAGARSKVRAALPLLVAYREVKGPAFFPLRRRLPGLASPGRGAVAPGRFPVGSRLQLGQGCCWPPLPSGRGRVSGEGPARLRRWKAFGTSR